MARFQASDSDKKKQILLKEGEKITCHLRIEKNLTAPVKKGQKIGQVTFCLGELVLDNYFVTADRNIVKSPIYGAQTRCFMTFFTKKPDGICMIYKKIPRKSRDFFA